MRILLVEDNPGDARLLQLMLKESGSLSLEVIQADRLSAALKYVAAMPIDVVVLDLSLPDSQGVETLVRMHAAADGVPIVVLTSIEDEALGVALVRAGAQDYLVKGQVTSALLTRALHYAGERKRTEEKLRSSETRIRLLLESTGEGIYGIDPEGRCTFINKAAARLLGYRPSDVLGQEMHALIHHHRHDGSPYPSEDCRIYQALLSRQGCHVHNEVLWRRDGTAFPVDYSAYPIEEHGIVKGGVVAFTDITERKRTEEALRNSEERYRSIFENAVEGIFQTTPAGQYLTVNPTLARLYGYESPQDMIGAVTDIARQIYVDPDRRMEFIRLMQEEGEVNGFESQIYRKDGSRIWISESVRALRDAGGTIVGYEGAVENITQRKEAEEQLQASFNLLRTLSRRLEAIREEERGRIARELHDQLGVGLTCLKMDLSRMPAMMGEGMSSKEYAKADSKIRSMIEDVDATIASVQRIVTELRPAMLDDLGLVAAIEWQAQDFERRSGITCRCLAGEEDITVDRERATVVFRICQEALTNIARHARATNVTIRFEEQEGSLLLEVQDNGQGIPQEKIADPHSLGLLGMRERAQLFGGHIDIMGRPAEGTTITLRLPGTEPSREDAAAVPY